MVPLDCKQNDSFLSLPARTIDKTGLERLPKVTRKDSHSAAKNECCIAHESVVLVSFK